MNRDDVQRLLKHGATLPDMKGEFKHLFKDAKLFKLLPILEGFAEGRKVEFLTPAGWIEGDRMLFDLPVENYRLVKEKLRYRCYLWLSSGQRVIVDTLLESSGMTPADMEKQGCFVRWIDTEWREVEL